MSSTTTRTSTRGPALVKRLPLRRPEVQRPARCLHEASTTRSSRVSTAPSRCCRSARPTTEIASAGDRAEHRSGWTTTRPRPSARGGIDARARDVRDGGWFAQRRSPPHDPGSRCSARRYSAAVPSAREDVTRVRPLSTPPLRPQRRLFRRNRTPSTGIERSTVGNLSQPAITGDVARQPFRRKQLSGTGRRRAGRVPAPVRRAARGKRTDAPGLVSSRARRRRSPRVGRKRRQRPARDELRFDRQKGSGDDRDAYAKCIARASIVGLDEQELVRRRGERTSGARGTRWWLSADDASA